MNSLRHRIQQNTTRRENPTELSPGDHQQSDTGGVPKSQADSDSDMGPRIKRHHNASAEKQNTSNRGAGSHRQTEGNYRNHPPHHVRLTYGHPPETHLRDEFLRRL